MYKSDVATTIARPHTILNGPHTTLLLLIQYPIVIRQNIVSIKSPANAPIKTIIQACKTAAFSKNGYFFLLYAFSSLIAGYAFFHTHKDMLFKPSSKSFFSAIEFVINLLNRIIFFTLPRMIYVDPKISTIKHQAVPTMQSAS